MRIGPPPDCIPAYVPRERAPVVHVTPLPPERAKELIDLGVFRQDPDKVLWTLMGSNAASAAAAAQALKAVPLTGGLQMQAWRTGTADASLLTAMFDAGNKALPILEQVGPGSESVDAVADGVAVLVATPKIFHAWIGQKRWSPQNVVLYGLNLLRLAGIANQFLHIPHADTPLQVATMIFKCGDEVFVASKPKGTAA